MKTMKQKPITVLGRVLKVGDIAEDFKAHKQDFSVFHLNDVERPYVVISSVPSLDTSVCSLQTRTINERLTRNPNVLVITISNDLPFAQKRWCGQEGLDVLTLSDHKYLDFAYKFGVLIDEMRLLARAVFVLNKNHEVLYVEYLDEMSEHPNYDVLIEFVENLTKA